MAGVDECPECGGDLYTVNGMTQWDMRDGIRNARLCGDCFCLFSSHAHGYHLQGKLIEPFHADGKTRLLSLVSNLEKKVEALRKEIESPLPVPTKG